MTQPSQRHDAKIPTTVRLSVGAYEWLRRVAFDRRTSQAQIVEEALELLRTTPDWSPEHEAASRG